jgi:hypothetical protein
VGAYLRLNLVVLDEWLQLNVVALVHQSVKLDHDLRRGLCMVALYSTRGTTAYFHEHFH